MDGFRFDRWVRALPVLGPRRGVLRLFAGLPLGGALAFVLAPESGDAVAAVGAAKKTRKERCRRRKGKGSGHHGRRKQKCHARRDNRKKHQKQKQRDCPSRTQVCAGQCGAVTYRCKGRQKTADCGSCACDPPCEACSTCQGAVGAPGTCVPESDGTPCGDATCEDGTFFPQGSCDGSGGCQAGTEVSCAPYTQCDGNACATSCADDDDCVAGSFCDGEHHCVGDAPDGQPCEHAGQCASGFCVDDVCCDSACNGACVACNLSGSVGACANLPNGDACGGDNVCCGGSCQECCDSDDCSGDTPICVGDTCQPCSAEPEECPGQRCCDAESSECIASCPASDPICNASNICVPCQSHAECGSDALCVEGQCHGCDVVEGQNLATAVAAAQDGDTLYVCAGTYSGRITIGQSITLIGAGQGADGTILVAENAVVDVLTGTAEQPVRLSGLRLQGAFVGVGIGNSSVDPQIPGFLTMSDCTVRGNVGGSSAGGGIFNSDVGTLVLTRCTLEENATFTSGPAGGFGGGLCNVGLATLTDCLIRGNAARRGGGIYNNQQATLTLIDTEVRGNTATDPGDPGGGIFNDGGTVAVQGDSHVCGNTPAASQCVGFGDPACAQTCPAL